VIRSVSQLKTVDNLYDRDLFPEILKEWKPNIQTQELTRIVTARSQKDMQTNITFLLFLLYEEIGNTSNIKIK